MTNIYNMIVNTTTSIRCLLLLIFSILVVLLPGCAGQVADLLEGRRVNLVEDQHFVDKQPFQIEAPLTLDKAIRIALERNLDAKVVEMESEIRKEMLTGARLKMLPELNARAELSKRNRETVSTSESFITGDISLEPSISSERKTDKKEISLLWNILDFGVSYYQSKQEESRLEAALQRTRKIRQNLILDVTDTYWQAIAEREAAEMAGIIIKRLRERLDIVNRQIEDRLVSEVEGLELATYLVETELKMEIFERDFQKHKVQLSTLMGLPQNTEFKLAAMEEGKIESLQIDVETLEGEALRNRPELFEHDLEERITADEARIKLIEMFPSPSLFLRYERDENKFLFYNDWWIFGVKAAWNLLSIPQKVKQRDAVVKQQELIRMQRIALGVGILTQLHLSVIDYQDSLRRYQLLKKLTTHRTALRDALERQALAGKIPGSLHLDSQSKAFFSEALLLDARADVHVSLQRIWNAIGRDSRVNPALLGTVISEDDQDKGYAQLAMLDENQVYPQNISGTELTSERDEKSEIEPQDRIIVRGGETYFIVKNGDSLADISGRKDVYGCPLKWPILFRYNQEKFKKIHVSNDFHRMPIKNDLGLLKIRSSNMAKVAKNEAKGKVYSVNVDSCRHADNLTLAAIRLIQEGFSAYIVRAKIKGKQWHRLRTGFYNSHEEAEKAVKKINAIYGLKDAWSTVIDKHELQEFKDF